MIFKLSTATISSGAMKLVSLPITLHNIVHDSLTPYSKAGPLQHEFDKKRGMIF